MDIFKHFNDYPLEYFGHWLFGAVTGYLFIKSVFRRYIELGLFAFALIIMFFTYECIEFVSVQDDPYIDEENFMATFLLTTIVVYICNQISKYRLHSSHNK